MSEQKIPAEMLDAATRAVGEYLTSLCIDDVDESAIAEVALRAAGVPALLARVAEMEAELGEANLIAEARSVVGMDLLAEADQQDARIAELEAQLAASTSPDANGIDRRSLDIAGNGRFVRNVVERSEEEREYRLAENHGAGLAELDEAQLMRIEAEDMRAALKSARAMLSRG